MSPSRSGVNLLAVVPLSQAHLVSREQRKKINRLVRLAKVQGGLRCHRGYIVPCHYCGWWKPLAYLTKEHLVNRRDGGTNQHPNLVLACYACNNGRNRRELAVLQPYGLEKWVRRRLRNFRMDRSESLVHVVLRPDGKLRLTPMALPERREHRARSSSDLPSVSPSEPTSTSVSASS